MFNNTGNLFSRLACVCQCVYVCVRVCARMSHVLACVCGGVFFVCVLCVRPGLLRGEVEERTISAEREVEVPLL